MPGKKKAKKPHPKPVFTWKWMESYCRRALCKRTVPVDGVFIDIGFFTHKHYDEFPLTPEGFHSPYFYDRVFEDIFQVVDALDPQKVVYIGKDGSEPWAKIRELCKRGKQEPQRKREKSELISFPEGPGSLDENFRNRIKKAKAELPKWTKLEVIYDPREALGEAEHKFLQYLRNESEARSWCIVTPDKDFAILMLSLRNPNIWIHRVQARSGFKGDDQEWDVGSLQDQIARVLEDKGNGIDDFIALYSIAGTDYLPKLAHWNHLVRRYHETTRGRPLITDGNIDKEVLKDIIKGMSNDKIWTGSDRERKMGRSYVEGILWTVRLFFGIGCDWYWAYPFTETPPIRAIVEAIDVVDFSQPRQTMHAELHKYEWTWKLLEKEASRETLLERVYQNEYSKDFCSASPTEQEKELRIRTSLRAMESLYQCLVGKSQEEEDDHQVCPEEVGLLWKYDSETQEERREHIQWTSSALPTMSAKSMELTKGEFVVAEWKRDEQDTYGFLAQIRGPGTATQYPVDLFTIPERKPKDKWRQVERCLNTSGLSESQVFAKTCKICSDGARQPSDLVLPLFIGEKDTPTHGRFGLSMVKKSKLLVSPKGSDLIVQFGERIKRSGPSEQIIKDVREWIERVLPESHPVITSSMSTPRNTPPVQSCQDSCYKFNIVHRYECGWAMGDIDVGMVCVSISRKCFARLGVVVGVNKETSQAIFFVANHKERDAAASDEPEFTDFGGILPKKRGILLGWQELLRCPDFPTYLQH